MKTYKQAGVDVGGADRFIRVIGLMAKRTGRHGVIQGIGSFGGLFHLNSGAGHDSVLVASADGVGTKLCLARLAGSYGSLGIDLVAMNVNDILCTGARPLFFLDYIAAGKLKPRVLMQVIQGIVEGCRQAGCVLLGGETAQMPLLYKPDDFDLAGFAVGVVQRGAIIQGKGIRPGDLLVGLASSGVHSNGFSLVQKVLSAKTLKANAVELLKPTRIYVRPVLDLIRRVPVKGIAHITGGSFEGKLPRILPEGCSAVLKRGNWKVPPVFGLIRAGGVSSGEMYRTFNMGIGMILVLSPSRAAQARRVLDRHRLANWVVGEVVAGRGKRVFIEEGRG
ncbi:MAG: phosphoribosylformylglycinamidine cyclo-ligase [Candidatus Omnitrophica bacterium]|nr:phosphoribosylformylglycinamidine cyclo-ligase [Candidatus Omnitrophota bacterium]